VGRAFFDDLEDALRGFLPPDLSGFSARKSGRNIKLWYGDDAAEHYEVQLASGKLEIGWHAEHRDVSHNDAALQRLTTAEKTWRKALGQDPVAGKFIGRYGPVWRRLSEVWDGPGLDDPETAIEAADRLATYVEVLEPVRRGQRRGATRRARP
jgi:hypothetical protein